jgi:hypothetical protein
MMASVFFIFSPPANQRKRENKRENVIYILASPPPPLLLKKWLWDGFGFGVVWVLANEVCHSKRPIPISHHSLEKKNIYFFYNPT